MEAICTPVLPAPMTSIDGGTAVNFQASLWVLVSSIPVPGVEERRRVVFRPQPIAKDGLQVGLGLVAEAVLRPGVGARNASCRSPVPATPKPERK